MGEKIEFFAENSEQTQFCSGHISMKTESPLKLLGSKNAEDLSFVVIFAVQYHLFWTIFGDFWPFVAFFGSFWPILG